MPRKPLSVRAKRPKPNPLKSLLAPVQSIISSLNPAPDNPQRGREKSKIKIEMRLLYLAAGLLIFGLLMVYSSSAVLAFAKKLSPFHYFILQAAWIGLGLIFGYIAYKFPLKQLPKLSVPTMVGTIVLLVLVLIIGKNVNGATRWIDLGPFDLQPSEIAKLGFVIYLSAWLAKVRPEIRNLRELLKHHLQFEMLPFILLMLIICVLIILQPDLDTAVIIAMTSLTIYFVSGRDFLHSLGSFFIIIVSGMLGVLAALTASYRLERVNTYIDFLLSGKIDIQQRLGAAFQFANGLIAISTGGIFGLGFTQSRQKFYYLQDAAFTDSIFSIIAEEFGLFGSLVMIVAFLYFMSLGIGIARKAPDRFSALLAVGITTWITLQAFLNIGANLAIIPFGGIPLPFISYGGSNTIIAMIGVGLLLNVSRHSERG